MSDAEVLAVVVTYNCEDHVGACLDALRSGTTPVDVVVVDNGSRDATVERVRRRTDRITLIEQENLGYAAGNNRGIRDGRRPSHRFAFVVNPDVVVDADCVAELVALMERRLGAAIVCPKILYPDGRTIWFAGASIDWTNGLTLHRGYEEPDDGRYASVEPIDRACGAAMLVRLSAMDEVGPMPEDYFLYFEETDWSRRFVAAGHELLYCPAARCRHDASSSTGRESPLFWYYMTRNSQLFMSRFGAAHRTTFRPALRRRSLAAVRSWLRRPNRGNLARAWAVAKGYADFALGRYGRGW